MACGREYTGEAPRVFPRPPEGGFRSGATHTRGVSAETETGPRLFGFPIRVSPWFFMILLFLGAPRSGEWTPEVLVGLAIWLGVGAVGVIWHELGHAFAMRHYGYSPSIALHGMGGHTSWGRGPTPSATQRLWVSLAGPFAGFAVGAIVFAVGQLADVAHAHWAARELYTVLLYVNVGWGIINLLPMLPWDGGHAVEALADRLTGGKGRKPAAVVTFLVAVPLLAWVVITFGFSLTTAWLGLLLGLSLRQAARAFSDPRPARSSQPLPPREALERARRALAWDEAAGHRSAERLVGRVLYGARAADWARLAEDLERGVLPELESADDRATARELSAWARLLAGDTDGAAANVQVMRESHEPSPALGSLVALRGGRWEEALACAEGLDPEAEEGERALLRAYALTMLDRHEEAGDAVGDDPERGALVEASLFRDGRFDAAAELARVLWERTGGADHAYNAACSHARARRPDRAIAWLERAVDSGYDDLEHLERDEDLASLRGTSAYEALRAKLDRG